MIDNKKMELAVKLFLDAIGENPKRKGISETPKRICAMCHELFSGIQNNPDHLFKKTFPAPNNDMVLEKDITFYSVCEHHLLPFYGKTHIAYIPNQKVIGISKLARCVDLYAKRLQLQEQMTAQIADALENNLNPKGIIVMIEAEHMCMTMRGIKKPSSKTISYVTRGCFKTDQILCKNFFSLVK